MSMLTDIEHWKLIRRRALEDAAIAVESEVVVEVVGLGDYYDYNTAIRHAAATIRALKSR